MEANDAQWQSTESELKERGCRVDECPFCLGFGRAPRCPELKCFGWMYGSGDKEWVCEDCGKIVDLEEAS